MKYTLTLLSLVISLFSIGQTVDLNKVIVNGGYGYQYKIWKVDSALIIPHKTDTTSKVPGQIKLLDNSLYFTGADGVWRSTGSNSGSSASTTATVSGLRNLITATSQIYFSNNLGGGTWIDKGLNDGIYTDDGIIHIITPNGHHLERQFTGDFKASWFGAVFDGTTDNLPAYIAMLNYANAHGGNINFELDNGTFFIGSAVSVPAITVPNVYFVGQGENSVIKPSQGTYFNYQYSNNTNFTKGGGIKNVRIEYAAADTVYPFINIAQAANQRFENITWYNGGKFLKAGNSTQPGYDIKFTKVTAVIANKGRAFVELANGAGFEWLGHNGISQMEATVPTYNTTSVMNTRPGTNGIDITGPWDSFFLDVFAEKLYRVVNAIITGADKTLFQFDIHNCVTDYIRDDAFHFEVDNLSAISQLDLTDNYMASWEGNGIYIHYQNGAGLYGLKIHGNKTIFAGKSGLDITNPGNSNPYYLSILNNKFQMTSRLGPQYPAVHMTSVLNMVMSNNVFGGGKLTPAGWEDTLGLVIDHENALTGIAKSANIINNYVAPVAVDNNTFTLNKTNKVASYFETTGGYSALNFSGNGGTSKGAVTTFGTDVLIGRANSSATGAEADITITNTGKVNFGSTVTASPGFASNELVTKAQLDASANITGEPSVGYIQYGTAPNTIGNSLITQNINGIGIGIGAIGGIPFQVNSGTNINMGFHSQGSSLVLNAFNNDGSLNIPVILKASSYDFQVGNANFINVSSNQYKLSVLNTAPTSATDAGTAGEIRFTATGIFICVAANTWIKCTAATF